MHAIIIHGMGRTPLSMYLLAYRLKRAGIKTSLFAYIVTFEQWQGCTKRLNNFIEKKVGEESFVVVTHSLGSVLIRAILPSMQCKPSACFFLAPPTQACVAAYRLAPRWWYRVLTGEMGQLLANQEFMAALPAPEMPAKIYAGDAGLTGRHSPFEDEPNDGVLMVKETLLSGISLQIVPSLHTFIMNSGMISNDIIKMTKRFENVMSKCNLLLRKQASGRKDAYYTKLLLATSYTSLEIAGQFITRCNCVS